MWHAVGRLASASASTFLAWMYVGGHIQNDTHFEGFLPRSRDAVLDKASGKMCIGDVCRDECAWWSWDAEKGDAEKGDADAHSSSMDLFCGGSWSLRGVGLREASRTATERALTCMGRYLESCVLSHEVDLAIPGVIVWNATKQDTQLFLLPRILRGIGPLNKIIQNKPGITAEDLSFTRTVVKDMYDAIEVEYYNPWTHETITEVIFNDASYCLQLLAYSMPPKCSADSASFSLLTSHDARL